MIVCDIDFKVRKCIDSNCGAWAIYMRTDRHGLGTGEGRVVCVLQVCTLRSLNQLCGNLLELYPERIEEVLLVQYKL